MSRKRLAAGGLIQPISQSPFRARAGGDTPSACRPWRASRYSFTGALELPLQILDGGFLSWIDPSDSGLYLIGAGDTEAVLLADPDELVRSTAPLRTIVDARTPPLTRDTLRPASTAAAAAAGAYDAVLEAAEGAALRTREALFSLASETG